MHAMNSTPLEVDVLRHVRLMVAAGTSPGADDLVAGPVAFEFICGIAPNGITPFEYRLIKKGPGARVEVEVLEANLTREFEHLAPPLVAALGRARRPARWFLSATVAAVNPAESREVVRALARFSEAAEDGCGCGGGGGCGCSPSGRDGHGRDL